ncbi:MAG: hypothetical protein OEX12_10840 [Gammaproteobacteria bacterium]|nr:hypothetical protein [Gammaproteobacteria bacterium]
MKWILLSLLTLCAACDGLTAPGVASDIDILYTQQSELIDKTNQMQSDTCALYREHIELLPPDYCRQKQLPPPPYTVQ